MELKRIVQCKLLGGPCDGQLVPIDIGWDEFGAMWDASLRTFAVTMPEYASEAGGYCICMNHQNIALLDDDGHARATWRPVVEGRRFKTPPQVLDLRTTGYIKGELTAKCLREVAAWMEQNDVAKCEATIEFK